MTKDELIRVAISIAVAMLILPVIFRGGGRVKPWVFPLASAIAVVAAVGGLILFGRD